MEHKVVDYWWLTLGVNSYVSKSWMWTTPARPSLDSLSPVPNFQQMRDIGLAQLNTTASPQQGSYHQVVVSIAAIPKLQSNDVRPKQQSLHDHVSKLVTKGWRQCVSKETSTQELDKFKSLTTDHCHQVLELDNNIMHTDKSLFKVPNL